MKFDVISYGELLWDINTRTGERHLGGAPANLAFHLHRRGIPVALASALGYDRLGVEALTMLRAAGLNLELVQSTGACGTGIVDVTPAGAGVDYVIRPGAAYDEIEPAPALLAAAARARFICYGTLVQRTQRSRETLYAVLDAGNAATKLLDVNLRAKCYDAETVARSLAYAHILKLNTEVSRPELGEVHRLAELLDFEPGAQDDTIARIMDRFPNLSCCLVTKAEHGVDAYLRGEGLVLSSPPYPAGEVVSVVGAGDCFTAGFVAAYLRGEEMTRCVDAGLRLASVKVTHPGAMAEITDADLAALPELPPGPRLHPAAREIPR